MLAQQSSPSSSSSSSSEVRVTIVGTGDLARALCHLFHGNHHTHSNNNKSIINIESSNNNKDNNNAHHESGGRRSATTTTTTTTYSLCVTKPGLLSSSSSFDTTIENGGGGDGSFHNFPEIPLVTNTEKALREANIVILAIPGATYPGFLDNYSSACLDHRKEVAAEADNHHQGVILVDVSNDGLGGCYGLGGATTQQQQQQQQQHFTWVRAFTETGAVELLLRKPWNKQPLMTCMSGSNPKAIERVQQFAVQALGYDLVRILPPRQHIKQRQDEANRLPKDWIDAFKVGSTILVCTEIYAVLRYNVLKGIEWFHMPVQITNKAICWTALTSFALTQIPGVVVKLTRILKKLQAQSQSQPQHSNRILTRITSTIVNHTNKKKKQQGILLLWWGLQIRKPLGLLALWLLLLHILMSMILLSTPANYDKLFYVVVTLARVGNNDTNFISHKLNAVGERSFFFAAIATGLYVVLGIASLPSVANQMNQSTWKLIYGPIARMALLFGTLHVYCMGDKWFQPTKWPGYMPPITLLSILFPILVMVAQRPGNTCPTPPDSNSINNKNNLPVTMVENSYAPKKDDLSPPSLDDDDNQQGLHKGAETMIPFVDVPSGSGGPLWKRRSEG